MKSKLRNLLQLAKSRIFTIFLHSKGKMGFHQDKYIYTVDLKCFEKCLTFKLGHLSEPKIGEDPFVRNNVNIGFGTMIGIFPIEKINRKYKSIEFENKYYDFKKEMEKDGYSNLFQLHAVLDETQAAIAVGVQHTQGRKRKRNPTFTIVESETEEVTFNSSAVNYVKGWLGAIAQYDCDTKCEIDKTLTKYGFRIEFHLQFDRSKNRWMYEGNPLSEFIRESSLHPTYIDDDFNHLFDSLEEIKEILDDHEVLVVCLFTCLTVNT
jgi:hypothetical protein